MKNMKQLAVLSTLLGASLLAPTASSEIIAGSAAQSRVGNEDHCFVRDFGRLSRIFPIPSGCPASIIVTATPRAITGSRTFKAGGRSFPGSLSSTNVTWCEALATDFRGDATQWTGRHVLNQTGGGGTITLGTFSPTSSEGVIFECGMGNASPSAGYIGALTY